LAAAWRRPLQLVARHAPEARRTATTRSDDALNFPIVPSKTAMLFFDTLNVYLHPKDEATRAAVEASGVVAAMQRINQACRSAGGAIFYAQADHRPDLRDFSPHIVDRGHQPTADGPWPT